ncbi:hypothetical protein A9Q86_12600 [Flavobacteriales bacterium 33_180_T64]|nr:hypothetical protein A9Q86_12600 [Flavobacteriales bacterium 33_180_T64]
MKYQKHKLTLIALVFIGILYTSCETENIQEEEKLEFLTNYELIKDNLKVYEDGIKSNKSSFMPSYYCSEQGGTYTSNLYVNHQIYLNDFYDPTRRNELTSTRYASWMTNLQSWLTYNFDDTNPNGSNSTSIDISFDVYGANGGTYLNATNGNRAYNEFVCQLMDQLSLTSASQLNNYEFALDITVDYFLCCDGTSCCNPVLFASGTAYY